MKPFFSISTLVQVIREFFLQCLPIVPPCIYSRPEPIQNNLINLSTPLFKFLQRFSVLRGQRRKSLTFPKSFALLWLHLFHSTTSLQSHLAYLMKHTVFLKEKHRLFPQLGVHSPGLLPHLIYHQSMAQPYCH